MDWLSDVPTAFCLAVGGFIGGDASGAGGEQQRDQDNRRDDFFHEMKLWYGNEVRLSQTRIVPNCKQKTTGWPVVL